jgi:hypothetical protein
MEAAGKSDTKQLTSGHLLGGFKIKMREKGVWSKIKSILLYWQSLIKFYLYYL